MNMIHWILTARSHTKPNKIKANKFNSQKYSLRKINDEHKEEEDSNNKSQNKINTNWQGNWVNYALKQFFFLLNSLQLEQLIHTRLHSPLRNRSLIYANIRCRRTREEKPNPTVQLMRATEIETWERASRRKM